MKPSLELGNDPRAPERRQSIWRAELDPCFGVEASARTEIVQTNSRESRSYRRDCIRRVGAIHESPLPAKAIVWRQSNHRQRKCLPLTSWLRAVPVVPHGPGKPSIGSTDSSVLVVRRQPVRWHREEAESGSGPRWPQAGRDPSRHFADSYCNPPTNHRRQVPCIPVTQGPFSYHVSSMCGQPIPLPRTAGNTPPQCRSSSFGYQSDPLTLG